MISKVTRILSEMRRLDTKALCDRKMIMGKMFFNRFARTLATSLYNILQRLIEQKSAMYSGCFFFSIRVINMRFQWEGMVPILRALTTASKIVGPRMSQ